MRMKKLPSDRIRSDVASYAKISERARELWQDLGYPSGRERELWEEAERRTSCERHDLRAGMCDGRSVHR